MRVIQGGLAAPWFNRTMTIRQYKRPSYRLILDFDPVTWDAIKRHAPAGQLERAAYKLIQDGLGVVTMITAAPAPADANAPP
jgi:hypothetical protein